ncbi:MAG TPA: MMPL family transporter [Planctomycetota bacterium]|nr:MMPL family transporter [Planctomycetota bacterium]
MKRGEIPRIAAGLLTLLVLSVWWTANMRVTTDITHFLPRGERDSAIDLAHRIATGPLSRTMILLVDASDESEAAAVSRAFEALLRAEPRVATRLESIDAGPPPGIEEALWSVYEARRFGFLAASPEAATERLSPAGLTAAVARLSQRLATPMSGLLSRIAPADPFLVMPTLFDRVAGQNAGNLGVVDDRFVTTGEAAAVLFLTTSASASDSTAQRPLLDGVREAFARLQQSHGNHLHLHESGVARHAIAAEESMQADVGRVGIGSTVGFLVVFLFLFGSLWPPLLCMPVLATGFFAGAVACQLAFGAVHGLTLAFGASLVGVSIDYAEHYFCHQALAPHPDGPRQTMTHLWRALLLSAGTTVVGFVTLLCATFPGLRELAVFATAGIAAALFASWAILPGCSRRVHATRWSRATVSGLRRALNVRGRARLWLLLPICGVLVVTALGLPRASWDDRLSTLNRVDPQLKAEDDAVHARVSRFEQRRVVVATGADEEAALAANDRVAAALAEAQRNGEIAGYGSIAPLLPSAGRQRAVDAAVRGDTTLWPRLRETLTAAGFVADGFAPFAEALARTAPPPVTASDLLATPLASLVRPFRLEVPDGAMLLSFVRGLSDEPALQQRLADIPGVQLLDIEGALTDAIAAYRASMTTLLAIGLLAVVLLVIARHRAVRPVVISCLPALLGAAGTVAVLALAGVALNLLSLVALLMIVSMGVDYGIFLAEEESQPGEHDVTYLSVSLAAVTTVLGFGLLALSEQPALFCIGLTSAVGILMCLVLALATGALLRPSPRSGVA